MRGIDYFCKGGDDSGAVEPAGGCGACTACCTVMGVHEINKPMYVKCDHVCASGCGIYPARPQSCRDWMCLWRRGLVIGGENYRPDKLGIILDVSAREDTPFGSQCLIAYEVRPGAMKEPRTKYFLQKVARDVPIVYKASNGTFSYGAPDHMMERARAFLAAYGSDAFEMRLGHDTVQLVPE